jgi:hypothetical protein
MLISRTYRAMLIERSLLNKAHRVQKKMGIAALLNQVRCLLDRLAETNVLHRDTKEFTAGFVILHDTKSQVSWIERSRVYSFVTNGLQVRQLGFRLSQTLHTLMVRGAGGMFQKSSDRFTGQ